MRKYMNTCELAGYLGINEKKIYSLIRDKNLPATKITGKWGFYKELVDIWLENSIENYPSLLKKQNGILMVTGSNDPLLDYMLNRIEKSEHPVFSFFCNTGSLYGLTMLNAGKVHISGSHLMDTDSEEYNIYFLASSFSNLRVVAINFAYRQQGLIVKSGNPLKIKGWSDLGRHGIRFINRNKGSGTRLLIDEYLKKVGIDSSMVNGYETEAITHLEVGISILKGDVDAGVGIKTAADMLNLDFIPLKKERFDLVIPREYFFSGDIQQIMTGLRSSQFKEKASMFGGYDTRDSGQIMYTS
ncbi:MAG: substrate-binding domain-containing protein [Nitrospirota bacterium]